MQENLAFQVTSPDFDKVGLLALREGRVLLCRKRHSTSLLILPGGCREAGESSIACLERELREELGEVSAAGLEYVGTYSHRAASDDPNSARTVRIELYRGELVGIPQANSEIRELVWFGEGDDWKQLAPSVVHAIFPDLIARGILPWSIKP